MRKGMDGLVPCTSALSAFFFHYFFFFLYFRIRRKERYSLIRKTEETIKKKKDVCHKTKKSPNHSIYSQKQINFIFLKKEKEEQVK
jgi:hypothetical protein